jgi:hypothetical protein
MGELKTMGLRHPISRVPLCGARKGSRAVRSRGASRSDLWEDGSGDIDALQEAAAVLLSRAQRPPTDAQSFAEGIRSGRIAVLPHDHRNDQSPGARPR